MSLRADTFDLGGLRLSTGEGRRLELSVAIEPFVLAGEHYSVEAPLGDQPRPAASERHPAAAQPHPAAGEPPASPALIAVRLDVSRMTGMGYALRLRFEARLSGPCMRCLEAADPMFTVDAREVSQPGEGDELASPYVEAGVLDLSGWSRDALALALPAKLLCRPECAGLCPVCGENLNVAGPEHQHERQPDARWAKLSELRFE